MTENRTAAETLRLGERVKIGTDGRVYRSRDGKLQAYHESAAGYLVQVGSICLDEPVDLPAAHVAELPKDPPSKVLVDGVEQGKPGGGRKL